MRLTKQQTTAILQVAFEATEGKCVAMRIVGSRLAHGGHPVSRFSGSLQ